MTFVYIDIFTKLYIDIKTKKKICIIISLTHEIVFAQMVLVNIYQAGGHESILSKRFITFVYITILKKVRFHNVMNLNVALSN